MKISKDFILTIIIIFIIIIINIIPIFPLRKHDPSCVREYNVLISSIISIFNPEENCARTDPIYY